MGDGLVDAGVQAEGEAVAGGVDLVDHRVEPLAPEAQHMQHRAEHLALQLGERADLDQGRRHEGARARARPACRAARRCGRPRAVRAMCSSMVPLASAVMTGPVSVARCTRVAERQLLERALQHGEDAIGDVLLQAEHPQRGTALAGGIEGGGDDVAHHLLGERGGIDDHRILPAGLGDERNDAAFRAEAGRRAGAGSAGPPRWSR